MKYHILLLLLLSNSIIISAQTLVFQGQGNLSRYKIILSNDTLYSICSRASGFVGCNSKMRGYNNSMTYHLIEDTLFVKELSILDSVYFDVKLLKYSDSLVVLNTNQILYTKAEIDRRLDADCPPNPKYYKLSRFKGEYKYDIINKRDDVDPLVKTIRIRILSKTSGYILYKDEKIKFTFTIQDCHIQIKAIDSVFPLLNLVEESVIDYSFDRLWFKGIAAFINTEVRFIDWTKNY